MYIYIYIYIYVSLTKHTCTGGCCQGAVAHDGTGDSDRRACPYTMHSNYPKRVYTTLKHKQLKLC